MSLLRIFFFLLLPYDSLPILLVMKFFISFQSLIYPKVMENKENMISHIVPLLANRLKLLTRQSVNPNWHQPSHTQRARERFFKKQFCSNFLLMHKPRNPKSLHQNPQKIPGYTLLPCKLRHFE